MYIGYMGDVPFYASRAMLRTPTETTRSAGSRWSDHDLLLRKPVSQFVGPELETFSFSLILSSSYGLDPAKELRKLREMRDNGTVFPLIIGGRPLVQNYWRLESLSEGENYYTADGRLRQTKVSVRLKEYPDDNYEENTALERRGRVWNAVSLLIGGD